MRSLLTKLHTPAMLIQLIVGALLILTPYTSLAVTAETQATLDADAPWYDSRLTCDSSSVTVPTTLKGNDNIEIAFRYFVDKNLTPEQSAAIVGNLQQESQVNPKSHQDDGGAGRGIAQWGVDGRWPGVVNFAKEQNKSEWDLGLQLDYIWKELHSTSYTKALTGLLAATNIEDMVIVISEKYEAAGKPEMPKRINYAKQILKLYGNTVATTTATASGSIYMIGDSITEGIASAGIADTLKASGWQPTTIDASQGRSITAGGQTGSNTKPGIDAIADDQAAIKNAAVIYVGLGTNPGSSINQTTWGGDIDRFVDKIRGYNATAPIYWLNVISPVIPDRAARNATLNTHAQSKGFTVIDATGVALSFNRGLHPNDYKPLKDFVAQALVKAQITSSSAGNSQCGDTGSVGNGQDTKYIDGFAIYNQTDPAWANKPFGSSTIGPSGCGPSAMAMIVTALTGKKVTPPDVATYAESMYVPGAGSSHQIGPFVAAHWGLTATPVGANVAKITEALLAGSLVVAPGHGADPFTKGGHYIVIRGVTASGKWKVGDSGHSDTSDKEWDAQTLASQMHSGGVYAISK